MIGLVLLVVAASCTSRPQPGSGSSTSANTEAPVVAGVTTSTAPVTSTDATSTSTTEVSESGWLRVSHDDPAFGGVGDQWVAAVTAGPFGFVAVGVDEGQRGFNEDDVAAVWLSPDGRSWSRVGSDSVFTDSEMRDVVWFSANELFVAVGHHVSEGAVWLSSVGSSWTRVALLPTDPAGGIEIESVIPARSGLVAVGREWLGEGASIPAVWTSTDARSWKRMDVDLSSLDPDHENAMVDVVDHGSGLLAVGLAGSSPSTYEPAMWQSAEGEAWQRVKIEDEDARDSVLNAIAANESSVVLVGESDGDHVDARAWVSGDGGRTWIRVEVETGQVGIPDLLDVVHTPEGWVAVGVDGTTRHEFGESIAAVWQSPDGVSWMRNEPHQNAFLPDGSASGVGMTSVTAFNGVVVVVGFEGAACATRFNGCDLDAAFWIRTANGS
jgi:hypothetical protein